MTDDDKPKKQNQPESDQPDRLRDTTSNSVQELDKNQASKEVTAADARDAGKKEDETRRERVDTSLAGKQFAKVEVAGADGGILAPGEAPKPNTERQRETLRNLIALRMRRGDGEPLGDDNANPELGKPKDNKNVWKEFRIRDQASPQAAAVLPDSGDKLVIGRSNDADFRIPSDGSVSRRNSEIEKRADGEYIRDLGSMYGTTIERNGKLILVPKPTPENPSPEAVKLQPGDVIRIGEYGNTRLTWEKPGAPAEKWKPAGYQPEKVRDGARQEERDAADPATSKKARQASNEYLRNHEYSGRMPDGFQIVGGNNQIDEKGQHNDRDRPSYVIDTRPGKDPALEKFIADARRDLAHLKDKPEELAKELARRAKEILEPKGWTDREVTDGYMKLRAEHAGGRLMLGDFITAAQKGEGAGVCNHQAALTKVAFDAFYPDDATRPKMTLVKGFYGSNPAGLSPAEALNHAWTTLEVNGKQTIYDPRGQIYGGNPEVYLDHHPGSEVPQLRPADAPPLAADKVRAENLVGREAGFGGQVWRIKEIKDGQAVLIADLSRVTSLKNLQTNNTGPDGQPLELRVGDTYKVKRAGTGEVTDGWTLQGWADPQKKDLAVMVKKDGVERSVPLDQLREQNAHLFRGDAPVADKPPGARDKPLAAPDRAVGNNPVEYGLVEGREVRHDQRNWYVAGYGKEGQVELHRAGTRQLTADEYRETNGDRQPKIGDDVWVQRSSGAMEKWRVTAIDPETGKISTRSESAYKETVPLDKLLKQNPEIERQHSVADVQRILSDPRSKVEIICPWTDAKKGHDVFIGKVTGANGENIKVMIHKPPKFGGDWERARNDMAAQAVARGMGKGEQFPATAFRDGMMVQAFVGREGENLHSYLHNMSRQDGDLRRAYPDLEKRIEKMMETIDPKLRTELARGVAFSALLGDGDQHGNNFVIEKTGPNPGDVRVARIDTDYAFNKNKTPVIDRQGNYGGVVNGLFAHFSGKELPAEVRAEIKQLSDRLNPADPVARKAAREQFAREAAAPGVKPLTAEQIDALAERAKFMSETGHFPESKPLRRSTDSVMMVGRTREPVEGDILGTVKSAPTFDHKAAIDALKSKLGPGQADQLREAFEKNVSGKDAADMQAKLKELADPANKSSAAEVKAWADVLVAKANHPELHIDVARVNGMKPNEVVDFAKFVKNVDKLDAVPKDAIAAGTVAKLKENLIAAASNPENAGRIAEFNNIIDKLSDAGFARQYGDQRAQHLGKLLEAQDRNALLNIPFEQLLDKDIHVDAMKFAADRFNEASRGFKEPVMTGDPAKDTGARVEFNSSMAAMKACKSVQPDGSRLIFIPAAHGAAADGFGIDGAILDLKTGKINPIDWTSNMSTKSGDKALWANEPPRTLIDRANIDRQHASGSSADMLKLLRDHARTRPGVTTDELKAANMTQVFPKFGADSNPVRQAEDIISGIKSFNRAFDARNPSNLLLQKMNDRGMNSTATYDAVKQVATRLGGSIANDIYTDGRLARPASANLDAAALVTRPVQIDLTRRSSHTGKPMEYVVFDLQEKMGIDTAVGTRGSRVDNAEVKQIRLYEDGTVVGLRQLPDGSPPKEIELGHIRNFKHTIPNPFRSDDPRSARFDAAVDRLLDVSAEKPIVFSQPNDIVRHLAQATEHNQVLRTAADRTRSIDAVQRNAPDLTEAEIDRVASSGKVPKGNLSADAYRRAAAELAAEDRFPAGQANAPQISDMADKSLALQKTGVEKEVARDAAALHVMHGMPEKDAVALAQVMAEVRNTHKGISFDRAHVIAAGEVRLAAVAGKATADVQAEIKDLLAKAKPGQELKDIYDGLLKRAEDEALKTTDKTKGWSDLHAKLDTPAGQAELAKLLGIPDGVKASDMPKLLKEAVDSFGSVQKVADVQPAPYTVTAPATAEGRFVALAGPIAPEFRDIIRDSLKANPNITLPELTKLLAGKAKERFEETRNTAWFDLALKLDVQKDNKDASEKRMREALGITDGATGQQVADALKAWLAKADAQAEPVKPVPADKVELKIPGLRDPALLDQWHQELRNLFPTLQSAPENAGKKLGEAMREFLAQYQIKDKAFSEENLSFEFSKDAKEPKLEIRDGKAKVTLPASMLSKGADPRALTAIVYEACMQQAAAKPLGAGETAGLHDWTTGKLFSHEELKLAPPTFKTGVEGTGYNYAQLPPAADSVAVSAVNDKGIRFGKGDQEINVSLADAYKTAIDKLEKDLAEEKKKSPDSPKVKELEGQLAEVRDVHNKLVNRDHPDHVKTVEAVTAHINEAATAKEHAERYARDAKAHGGGLRGRLVALTLIAGFLMRASQAEGKRSAAPPVVPQTYAFAAGENKSAFNQRGELLGEPLGGPGAATGVRRNELGDAPAAPDANDKAAKPAEAPKLDQIPDNAVVKASITRLLPMMDKMVAENNRIDSNPKLEPVDQTKLQKEWESNEFGPESQKAWRLAQIMLEKQVVSQGQMLIALSVELPVGAPIGPRKSESGTGLIETEEAFRSRLRAGEVKCDLGKMKVDGAAAPGDAQVKAFLNAVGWLEVSDVAKKEGFVRANAAFTQMRIDALQKANPEQDLSGWRMPKDANPAQLDQWAMKAKLWLDKVDRVKAYAEMVHALNHASTAKSSCPSLNNLFQAMKGIGNGDMTFPADAIDPKNFSMGSVNRNVNLVEVKLKLPKTLDPSAENDALMKDMDGWMAKWGPHVDQVTSQIMKQMGVPFIVGKFEIEGSKTVKVDAVKENNPDLKGDASDVNKPVKIPGEDNWYVKEFKNGEYKLERRTADGQPINYERSGCKVEKCDANGKLSESGAFLKVTGTKELCWASWCAYNGWWGYNKLAEVETVRPQVVSPNDYVMVTHNGQVRLLQAKNIQAFKDATENAQLTGEIAGFTADAAMLAIGAAEFRAGWKAAQFAGEATLRQAFSSGLNNSWWHLGLGITGFLKQGIENNIPGGKTLMELRHYAIMLDMGMILTPKSFQASAFNPANLTRTAKSAEYMQAFQQSTRWYDRLLNGVLKGFQGDFSKLPKLESLLEKCAVGRKVSEQIKAAGLMYAADMFFLADFSNQAHQYDARNTKSKYDLVSLGRKPGETDNAPLVTADGSPDYTRIKALLAPGFENLSKKLGSELLRGAPDVVSTPPDNPARQAYAAKAAAIFNDAKQTEKERTAAALALLALRTEGGPNETIGGVKVTDVYKYLKQRAEESKDYTVRMIAGETLYASSRTAAAVYAGAQADCDTLEAAAKAQNIPLDGSSLKPEEKKRWDDAKKKLDDARDLCETINFGPAEYSKLLLGVLRDPNAPREAKLDAIASPTGPRLAAVYLDMVQNVHPTYSSKNVAGRAGMYGVDAYAIDAELRKLATDGKQHADVRALASQALTAMGSDRLTINGTPITPGSSFTVTADGAIHPGLPQSGVGLRQDGNGNIHIWNPNSDVKAYIIGEDGKPELVTKETILKPGQKVVIGDPQKGAQLAFSNERVGAILRLGAQVRDDGAEEGAIGKNYAEALNRTLDAKLPLDVNEQRELFVAKYRAALAVLASDTTSGATASDLRKKAVQNLADVALCPIPELAAAGLRGLREHVSDMSEQQKFDIRQRFVSRYLRNIPTTDAQLALVYTAVDSIPKLFADATPEQKQSIARSLECLLIPGMDKASEGKAGAVSYAVGTDVVRAKALSAMASLNVDKASELAKVLLVGGTYNGLNVNPDAPSVRLAAAKVIQTHQPLDWHDVALTALSKETDPTVARALWAIEYGSRRADADPVRLFNELAALERRLSSQAGPWWADGSGMRNQCYDNKRDIQKHQRSGQIEGITVTRTLKGNNLTKIPGLLYLYMTQDQDLKSDSFDNYILGDKVMVRGNVPWGNDQPLDDMKRMQKEHPQLFAVFAQSCMENALLMDVQTFTPERRAKVLELYLQAAKDSQGILQPGDVGGVLTRMLQNSISTMAKPGSAEYDAQLKLQRMIVDKLREYPCDAAIPVLTRLANGKDVDAAVVQSAKQAMDVSSHTTRLAWDRAHDEILFAQRKPDDPEFAALGKNATPQSLAAIMSKSLTNPSVDGYTVAKTLIAGMEAKPLTADDPRHLVIAIALKDKNELVRLTAARLSLHYPGKGDVEGAVFALTDLVKNGSSAAAKAEAQGYLDMVAKANPKLVERANAEVLQKPPEQGAVRPDGSPVALDARFQRFYDNVEKAIADNKLSPEWTNADYAAACKRLKKPLLENDSLKEAFRGVWDASLADGRRGLFDRAQLAPLPDLREDMWKKARTELDDVKRMAADPALPEEVRRDARKVLEYIITSKGEPFAFALYQTRHPDSDKSPQAEANAKKMTDEAVQAVCDLMKAGKCGANEFDYLFSRTLVGNAQISYENKTKLAEALNAVAKGGGSISAENAVAIAMLALESDIRFGSPGPASAAFQKALLKVVADHGNDEASAALKYIAESAPDPEVKALARQAQEACDKRKSVGVNRLVNDLVSNNKDTYTPIRSPRDPRVAPLANVVGDSQVNILHRARAAEVLMDPRNPGVPEITRRKAAEEYSNFLTRTDVPPEKQLRMAENILNPNNPAFDDAQRQRAARAVASLALSASPSVSERAKAVLSELKGTSLDAAGEVLIQEALLRGKADAIEAFKSLSLTSDKAIALVNAAYDQKRPPGELDTATKQRYAEFIASLLSRTGDEGPKPSSNPNSQIAAVRAYLVAVKGPTKDALEKHCIDVLETWSKQPLTKDDPRLPHLAALVKNDDPVLRVRAAELMLASRKDLDRDTLSAAWHGLCECLAAKDATLQKRAQTLIDEVTQDTPNDSASQALLWQAAQFAEHALPDSDFSKKLGQRVRNLSTGDSMLRITDDKDPRLPFITIAMLNDKNRNLQLCAIAVMLNSPDFKDKRQRETAIGTLDQLAKSEDADVRKRALEIAVDLGDDKRKDVPKSEADDARKIVYWAIDKMKEDAGNLEHGDKPDKPKAAALWKGIDETLARIGQPETDYSRTFATMKRLELEGGKEKELVPLYKRLAEISEQRGAKEAAELFKKKSERAELGTADGGAALKTADGNFAQAKKLVASARSAQEIYDAEQKLKDCVAAYKTAAGPKSIQAADALTELAKYYASQGKMDQARTASKEAVAIFEGEGAARHPITARQKAFALGTLATSTYGVPGQERENKDAIHKLAAADDAGVDRKNPATQQILTDLVDYMLSKGAIKDDSMQDAEALLKRAAEARVATFGKDSVEAGQGSERLADFYLQTGQPQKAIGEYRAAAAKYEGNPAMIRQSGMAQAKLAQSLSWTGDYRGAHAAMEKGIATMAQPGSPVTPVEIEMQVRQYQQMLVNHGQPAAAEQWEKRLTDYKKTGVLDTRPTGQVQTQWPSPGMGTRPPGGNRNDP